ncbi:MAG: short-chain dehydrogenase/reductase [Planctomycetes bacterium]|nr:short-chain dehydrogenase/reductase [Planctomycetota bacterium]
MPEPTSRATLVTGCSSGIGRAIANRIAGEGWPVYASARDPDAIQDLTAAGCTIVALDANDSVARAAVVSMIEGRHGAVGALINNAGYGQQGPFEETPLAAFREQFETNVFSAVGLCQLVLPAMRRQHWGRIVNISSMGGRLTFPGGAAYHGSKYALEAISDVLRFEVERFGVDVVLVEPGPTSTSFGAASLRSLDALEPTSDRAYDEFRTGIRRALESTFERSAKEGASRPEEVAEAVWTGLTSDTPEPRVVVGKTAEELIALKERGTAREWDRVVAGMYPQPRPSPEEPS